MSGLAPSGNASSGKACTARPGIESWGASYRQTESDRPSVAGPVAGCDCFALAIRASDGMVGFVVQGSLGACWTMPR